MVEETEMLALTNDDRPVCKGKKKTHKQWKGKGALAEDMEVRKIGRELEFPADVGFAARVVATGGGG